MYLSISEVAARLGVSRMTAIRLFANEAGIIDLGRQVSQAESASRASGALHRRANDSGRY
jgi:hypothetical protein